LCCDRGAAIDDEAFAPPAEGLLLEQHAGGRQLDYPFDAQVADPVSRLLLHPYHHLLLFSLQSRKIVLSGARGPNRARVAVRTAPGGVKIG
jgi:hypothetical protein